MLEIKNFLFQPLTLHLADSNKSIHLSARGKATIKDKDLSQEIKKAKTKGWVSVKTVDGQDAKKPKPTTKAKRRAESFDL